MRYQLGSSTPTSPWAMARSFFERDPLEVAPDLLGKVLVGPHGSGRVVEVEAYRGSEDPASHAFRGPTPRNRVMFGPAGHLYVYRSYGIHWCANVVAGDDGVAAAVLIRALEPLTGVETMATHRRAARGHRDLANGPGKLCQALGIDGSHGGVDLLAATGPVRMVDDGTPPPPSPTVGPRVGITVGTDRPWRFSIPGSRFRSRPVPVP